MKYKTKFVCLIMLIVAFILTACGAEYDSSIHDAKIAEINNNSDLTKYINYYEALGKNDIMIIKSEDKEESEFTDGKVYQYTVLIDVNSNFMTASRSNQFDFVSKVADIFEDTVAGEGTSFVGIYDKVLITSRDNDPEYMKVMNIHGVRKLDRKTRDEYTFVYYDSKGNPVYD
ncbi:hypothetical protein HP548_23590 [Paenibacillus taichungensis]|uniref:Lipoprotein n=1 Tax=Paenibacillus taichungensis TaxID=484184 RepID=A0ABX2MSK8_9BACL|nr:hypothetical protein [Paenibacillus taichungensis]